ncbi:ATP-binding protein [Schleiferilactobacillus shenzhenensis]|uniref:RecG n=1 Tax=Schleiferilactobacillus shenzhenensis LY-73 TaxID=1231336 RepID=U4TKH1_9LACO|nr:ATP-binding protein [Schleiferilactobacillus shenzhenensis]ERL63855.1 RecG [Schleiferilactobacillus shenzhenensis LY-73]
MNNFEDANIEYKSQLTNRLKREIVSFLNSPNGGVIYLGIDDITRKSLPVSDAERKRWEETISNWALNAFYPIPYSLIEVLPNKQPFTVKVRGGRNKPYAISSNGFDSSGVYVREGSSAVKATNERIRRMQQEYQVSGEFDSEPADEQQLTFKVASDVFENLDVDFDQKALRLVKDGKYNNAALLVSDQNPYPIKLGVYDGLDVMKFLDKREFSGAMTKQIDEVLNYLDLANHNQVVITGKGQRQEKSDFPTVAIREAVINAFVHRDYLLHSNVKIELFNDRLEIVSPGGIPDGLTLAEIKDGLTAARNPRLIHILDKMQYIENYGTGIRRMYRAYGQDSQGPRFEVRDNSFKVVLPNRNYMSTEEKAPEGDPYKTMASGKSRITETNEARVLAVLRRSKKPLKRLELQSETGLTRNQIFAALRVLRAEEKILVVGTSVNTRYVTK